jgi:hypothetical protein
VAVLTEDWDELPSLSLSHLPLVVLFLMFRNPEFGHELGTKSFEDRVASGGPGTVIAAIAGAGSRDRTHMIVRATPPATSRTSPAGTVMDDPNNTNSPNAKSHTGMTAVRLNSIDMAASLLSCCGLQSRRKRGGCSGPSLLR